jgi:hypothetical protein
MEFLRADLAFLDEGSSVSVDMNAPADVRLMVAECSLSRQPGFPYLSCGRLYPARRSRST